MRAFRAAIVFVLVMLGSDVAGVSFEYSFPLALVLTALSALLPVR